MTNDQLLFELRRQLTVAKVGYLSAVEDIADVAGMIHRNVSTEDLTDWNEKFENESKYRELF